MQVSKAREVCISLSIQTANTFIISTEGDLGQGIGYQSVSKPRGEKRKMMSNGTEPLSSLEQNEQKRKWRCPEPIVTALLKCRTPGVSWRLCWSFWLVAFILSTLHSHLQQLLLLKPEAEKIQLLSFSHLKILYKVVPLTKSSALRNNVFRLPGLCNPENTKWQSVAFKNQKTDKWHSGRKGPWTQSFWFRIRPFHSVYIYAASQETSTGTSCQSFTIMN